MSIEDVVKELETALRLDAWLSHRKVRALLDAYRELEEANAQYVGAAMMACSFPTKAEEERDAARAEVEAVRGQYMSLQGLRDSLLSELKGARAELSDALAEVDGLTAINTNLAREVGGLRGRHMKLGDRVISLEEENARLKQEAPAIDWKKVASRATELLSSARAQGEAHLQARLEAERESVEARKAAEHYRTEYKWINENFGQRVDLILAPHKNRFRRLAKRYLGLRFDTYIVHENMRSYIQFALKNQDRAEAAEQRVKELEALVDPVNEWARAAEDRAEAAESKVAELQKRVDDLESRQAILRRRLMEDEELLVSNADEWSERWRVEFDRAEHAESVAMGSTFELGRALELLRRWGRSYGWCPCNCATCCFLSSFDAPGGGR